MANCKLVKKREQKLQDILCAAEELRLQRIKRERERNVAPSVSLIARVNNILIAKTSKIFKWGNY